MGAALQWGGGGCFISLPPLFSFLTLISRATLFRPGRSQRRLLDSCVPRAQCVPKTNPGPALAWLLFGWPIDPYPSLLPYPDPPGRCPICIIPSPDCRLVVPRVPFVTQVCQLAIQSLRSAAHLSVGAAIPIGQPVGAVLSARDAVFALIICQSEAGPAVLPSVLMFVGFSCYLSYRDTGLNDHARTS